ncbi:hypothetical protein [Brevibacterium sandarakinum]|uniref:hypothetical protein n=1 Tax=Brevibacterium sandarakinum TaxID=629680 RepID=UPI0012FDC447|nr:hypothetical protein [Brevibacterium sandarakinum]
MNRRSRNIEGLELRFWDAGGWRRPRGSAASTAAGSGARPGQICTDVSDLFEYAIWLSAATAGAITASAGSAAISASAPAVASSAVGATSWAGRWRRGWGRVVPSSASRNVRGAIVYVSHIAVRTRYGG